jgi:hypothetical protein
VGHDTTDAAGSDDKDFLHRVENGKMTADKAAAESIASPPGATWKTIDTRVNCSPGRRSVTSKVLDAAAKIPDTEAL